MPVIDETGESTEGLEMVLSGTELWQAVTDKTVTTERIITIKMILHFFKDVILFMYISLPNGFRDTFDSGIRPSGCD